MFQPPFRSRETAVNPARGNEAEITELQGEVERLLLISEALWRILKEKHGLEEKDLVREITMIDLEDGRLDGRKPTASPEPCPKCGRTLGKHRPRCLFCGEPIAARPFDR